MKTLDIFKELTHLHDIGILNDEDYMYLSCNEVEALEYLREYYYGEEL